MNEGAWNLGALPWSQLGPAGLLALTVGLILFGWLVPRRTLRDAQKERDEWKYLAQATLNEFAPQMAAMVDASRTSEQLLRSILSAGGHSQELPPAKDPV